MSASPGPADRTNQAGLLVLVAIAYALAQLVFCALHMGLGWDETVYVSQVSPHVLTEYFSPPRARGITFLAAPVVQVTTATVAIRLYMILLASGGLIIAYWPWLSLLRARIVALAALLLTGLWVVQFYGSQVMPNLYVAYGAVAATGCFLRLVLGIGGRRSSLIGLGTALAFMTLMRPPDALFLAVTLIVAGLAVRAWRQGTVLVTIAGGTAAGLVPWLAESWARFGGPLERLRLSGHTEGGMGFHPGAIWLEIKALNGPALCRPCSVRMHHPELTLWWFALPVVAGIGVWIAVRTGRRAVAVLATAAGIALSLSYFLTLQYAAPRFLIPMYALLVLPVGIAIDALIDSAPAGSRRHRLVAGGLLAALALQLFSQNLVLRHRVSDQQKARNGTLALARELHSLGVKAPCVLAGDQSPFVGYYAGCATAATSGDNPYAGHATILSVARRACAMAVLASAGHHPTYLTGWSRRPFTVHGAHWTIYLPPRPPACGRTDIS